MDNVFTTIGESKIVNIVSEITGRLTLSLFDEVIAGETSTRFLKKEFRISEDNIFWTDWQELTLQNLGLRNYNSEGRLYIQLRYTRQGTDTSGEITWSSIRLMGDVQAFQQQTPTLDESIFSGINNTGQLIEVGNNLFKKLYYRGILPAYIKRAENNSYEEDHDFVDFFKSVARFFSLLLIFSDNIEDFNEDFLREQLNGYGIIFETDAEIEELRYLCQNIFSQIQQRGTAMIFTNKGDELPSGQVALVNGEYLRLIEKKLYDEFLYEVIPNHKIGWNIGNSSPLYRGTAQAYHLNKTGYNNPAFTGLTFVYEEEGSSEVTLSSLNYVNLTAVGGACSIGRLVSSNTQIDIHDPQFDKYVIPVDSSISYEITFEFYMHNFNSGFRILFGVEGFDLNKNKFLDAFIDSSRMVVSEDFFDIHVELSDNIFQTDTRYVCRGIIHSYNSKAQPIAYKTNMGFGHDLIFNNAFTKFIVPRFMVKSEDQRVVVTDYKIRPLVRGKGIQPLIGENQSKSFSLGFLQSKGFTHIYSKNNSNKSNNEIQEIAEKILLPYNTTNIFTNIKE